MQVWIGTSGYSYPDWVGPFYPPKTRSNQMLSYYTGQFPVVELNFTFYRLPAPGQLARLADNTPPGFQFVVKVPQTLSHDENPRDLPAFQQAVEELQRRDRLLGLLCQFPQSIHYQRRHLGWLDTLGRALADYHMAVEFRHRSWFRPDVAPWLRERNLDLVAVDVPDLPGLYPRGLVQSGPRVYVRFHSRNAANWYLGDKERYDFHYDDASLREWVSSLSSAATTERTEKAFLFLNNCRGGQAVDNARRLRELLAGTPGIDVVEPFTAQPVPEQRELFN